jgi:hypothetical protein
MTDNVGDAPIEPRVHSTMNVLARMVDEFLNGDPDRDFKIDDRKNGFVLLVFPFEGHEGRCNYISNANRADIVVMLKEQLARLSGQPEIKGRS